MTDQNLTEIICIIDRSGSMANIRNDAIGGFNTFLKEQQKIKSDRCLFTYAQFDDEYEVVHDCKPIEDIPPLDESTFVPRSSTALLDAMGKTIASVGERLAKTDEDKRPSIVIVMILTDGQENASREYTKQRINEMVKTQREQFKWEFVFLAANQDAIAEAHSYGIQAKNAANFSPDSAGMGTIYGNVSKGVTSYRATKCSADLKVDDAVSGSSSGSVSGLSSSIKQ